MLLESSGSEHEDGPQRQFDTSTNLSRLRISFCSAREKASELQSIFRVLKISIMQWCIIFRVVSSYSHDFLPLVGCCIRRCMEETCCLDGRCVNFCSGFSTISNCLVLALLLSNPCKDLLRSELNRLLVFLTNASWAGFPDNLPHELRKPPVSL